MNEITLCPFCGSNAAYASGNISTFYVTCPNCGCFGPTHTTKERAIHAWNKSNDNTAALVALVNVIQNRPVIESFLQKSKGAKTTWKIAREQAKA